MIKLSIIIYRRRNSYHEIYKINFKENEGIKQRNKIISFFICLHIIFFELKLKTDRDAAINSLFLGLKYNLTSNQPG